ncbi:hypothetical protein J113_14435 [Mycobacterium tuberculosis CAS/NITR204]|uniref:Uncharacterized protein n=2 Tax=Mycobacterium tuberculosis TaxID=1773 RepID=R4MHY3_MYCTX|nr:hypothetical protein J113_14435 [Mycobacterium tuberculosis CAS/NITR204]CKT74508.1 Uncharacterised protein [Mycobacterium tuberculosis]
MPTKFLTSSRGGNNPGRRDLVTIGGCGGVVLDEVGERAAALGGVAVRGWCDVMVTAVTAAAATTITAATAATPRR